MQSSIMVAETQELVQSRKGGEKGDEPSLGTVMKSVAFDEMGNVVYLFLRSFVSFFSLSTSCLAHCRTSAASASTEVAGERESPNPIPGDKPRE